jgi:predicted glycosyltransferase
MGLGHLRRNLAIAESLTHSPSNANALVICGAALCRAFSMSPRIDCLTLPGLYKEADGSYRSRLLDLSLQELIAVRSEAICGALKAFQPDVLIVDGVPHGANAELDQTLEALRLPGRTRCVLGLRDVLDEPATIRTEWRLRRNEACIRDYYDAVWVYGDRAVYDLVEEYGLSGEVAQKVRYIGYIDHSSQCDPRSDATALKPLGVPRGRLALCASGGGQDGARLALMFSKAELPADMTAVILTGPFMPPEIKRALYARMQSSPRLTILEFHPEPVLLIRRADRVVAMGGYNTICEVLSLNKRALVIPRVTPRREQWIRAQRLHQMGLLDMCDPDHLKSGLITEWLATDLGPPPLARERIDLNGLSRLPSLLEELLARRVERRKSVTFPPLVG